MDDSALQDVWRTAIDAELSCPLKLFPVPPIPEPARTHSRSPRLRARMRRRLRRWRAAEELRCTLNELWDGGYGYSSGTKRETNGDDVLRHAHEQVWHRLLYVSGGSREGCRPSATGGLLERLILQEEESYLAKSVPRYVAINADRIAEPPAGSPVVDFTAHIPQELARRYMDEEYMIKPGVLKTDAWRTMRRQFDGVLGSESEYIRYFWREGVSELWDVIADGDEAATFRFACVGKRDPSADRKILQVCPFNEAAITVAEIMKA